ncbi:hypothetical protein D8674_026198 [Pyrus ussuriensis x Pyrus communis]|uniref:Uncharacterized protein n=1 Tax=Pyrus ussuriensis x Pyrus communis TaxID=2448454 RepID=A0A5N5IKN2_9ROSA|nr:hypothetical protein D8674_026198 [Pyrus ussuriensis x Pyrus communis]
MYNQLGELTKMAAEDEDNDATPLPKIPSYEEEFPILQGFTNPHREEPNIELVSRKEGDDRDRDKGCDKLDFQLFEPSPPLSSVTECYMIDSIEPNVDDSFILSSSKDPFEVHCSNYGREFGIEPKTEVMHAQLTFSPLAKIWWKRQPKKVKKRMKSRALKLKKKQKYAVPHCLVSTPNFKATRWKKRNKKKIHGVVPHLNDPPFLI